jgi:hypothetical protein
MRTPPRGCVATSAASLLACAVAGVRSDDQVIAAEGAFDDARVDDVGGAGAGG